MDKDLGWLAVIFLALFGHPGYAVILAFFILVC